MKKFLQKASLVFAAALVAMSTFAQSIDLKKEWKVSPYKYVHPDLTLDGKVFLLGIEEEYGYQKNNGQYCDIELLKKLSIINSNLETVKEFTSGPLFEEFEETTVIYSNTGGEKKEISRFTSKKFNLFRSSFVDFFNCTGGDDLECIISQNFFNNDEKFEFVLPILELTENSWNGSDGTVRVESEYKCIGCKVVNEDGTVLHEITFPNDDFDSAWPTLVKFPDKNYLCITKYSYEGEDSRNEVTCFYEINKNDDNSSINKVREIRGMKIFPTIADRNENITITLNDGENDSDRELIVTGVNGQLVERRTIPAGENKIEINASMLRSGMYNFTLQKKGSFVENGKVIVK